MILTLDTGNSNIKIGIYDGDARIQYARLATDVRKTSDEYGLQIEEIFQYAGLSRKQVDGVIISSVVPSLNYTPVSYTQDVYKRQVLEMAQRAGHVHDLSVQGMPLDEMVAALYKEMAL